MIGFMIAGIAIAGLLGFWLGGYFCGNYLIMIEPNFIREDHSGRIIPVCACGNQIKYCQKFCDECGSVIAWEE